MAREHWRPLEAEWSPASSLQEDGVPVLQLQRTEFCQFPVSLEDDPMSQRRVTTLDGTMMSAQGDPGQRIQSYQSRTSDLQICEIINLSCFELLSLWQFVIQQQKNNTWAP